MSTLYIVATPIGNLSDITLRALATLKAVDLIACEDTRLTSRLLNKYEIHKPTISYHQHSSPVKTERIIQELKNGKDIALVSDAGTPGISDPGNQLVAAAAEAGIKVVPIPGPSAIITALSAAGLPTDRFIFFGFIPHKKRRQTTLREIAEQEMTVVFYESSHRIVKALDQLKDLVDLTRRVVVARELTKIYEEIVRGNIEEVYNYFKDKQNKGEFVVILEAKK